MFTLLPSALIRFSRCQETAYFAGEKNPFIAPDATLSANLLDKDPALLLRRGSAGEIGAESALRLMLALST